MSAKDLERALELVGKLDAQERQQLRLALDALGSSSPTSSSVWEPSELLWSSFVSHLETLGVQAAPLGQARRNNGWSAFVRVSEQLDRWVTRHFDPETVLERKRAYKVCARCVIRSMHDMKIPITTRTLLQQSANATGAVDRQYPGYAEAGVLKQFAR